MLENQVHQNDNQESSKTEANEIVLPLETHQGEACEDASIPQEKTAGQKTSVHEKSKKKMPALESSKIKQLRKEVSELQEPERKVEHVLSFMQASIAQTGSPHFRDFWDAKKLCQDLFKENINPTSRLHYWTTYSELAREARRLKEMFDEQSAFACEQIEIAVKAVEDEIEAGANFDPNTYRFQFHAPSFTLGENIEAYSRLQIELDVLNLAATRVNSLRKELMKTEMRVRDKNKFFDRLSKIGNHIFPRRKFLIHEVSELFVQDVDRFIKTNFSHECKTPELFKILDEIKALQAAAKQVTLNTEAFSKTRVALGECWDSLKHLIDEKKKKEHEQKSDWRKARLEHEAHLENLKKKFNEKTIDSRQALVDLEEIVHAMRKTPLGRIDVLALREVVRQLRDEFSLHAAHASHKEMEEVEKRSQAKMRAYDELLEKIEHTRQSAEAHDIKALEKLVEDFRKEMLSLTIGRAQKVELERGLQKLKDLILAKKEEKTKNLSSDDQEALSELKSLFDELIGQRKEIKALIEKHRKTKGSSTLDFTFALQAVDALEEQKERLEKIEEAIVDVKAKLKTLES